MTNGLMPKFELFITILLLSASAWAADEPNRSDPENAAYWYRQAFALYEEPEGASLRDYVFGECQLTPEMEAYLDQQQPVLRLVA